MKTHLLDRQESIRSRTPQGVRQELWGIAIAYNLIRLEMERAAAEAGIGLCLLPTFIASPALESGTLVPLLTDFPLQEGGLHAVMPPGRASTARVRALVDFLVARFGPEPSWDPCWAHDGGAVDASGATGRARIRR